MPFVALQSLDVNTLKTSVFHVRPSDVKMVRNARSTQVGKTVVEFFHTNSLMVLREDAEAVARSLGLSLVHRWSAVFEGDREPVYINASRVVRVFPHEQADTSNVTFDDKSALAVYGVPEFVTA